MIGRCSRGLEEKGQSRESKQQADREQQFEPGGGVWQWAVGQYPRRLLLLEGGRALQLEGLSGLG